MILIKIILIIIGLVFVFLIAIPVIGNLLFSKQVSSEVEELFKHNQIKTSKVITEKDLEVLPEPVQKWLRQANIVGKEKISTVRLKQEGLIRTTEKQPWMPAQAEQYFTVDKPGFIWKVRVKVNPLLFLVGRDKYLEGKGNMLIKLLAFINVVNAQGKEIDQGTLLRYLGEIVWFPSGALSDYIKWQAIDNHSARATMTYGGITASAVFSFDEDGNVESFSCKRYKSEKEGYSLEDYFAKLGEYKTFEGIKVPTQGEVSWKLKSGDFTYYKLEVTHLEYNKSNLF